MRKLLVVILLLLGALWPARAQFYLSGDDPSCLRWYQIQTPHYQIIYPQGTDSLARVYGRLLEQFRPSIGLSLGVTPGDGQRRKMPVVLHTHHVYSNGSVGWAPKRLDLYTRAEPYGSDPMPWAVQLTAHEPRHQAQMQKLDKGILPILVGQTWAPFAWQLYMDRALGEGDAVITETALTPGTRAYTADFLNYYRVALDQGDYRNWYRWRYGSYKHYTPDYYALGYLMIGSARALYQDPLLVRESVDLSWKKPWMIAPFNFRSVLSQHSGKPFKETFRDMLDSVNERWQADARSREPFMPLQQMNPLSESYATEYSTPVWTGDALYVLRESKLRAKELVRIQDGKYTYEHSFSGHTSSLFYEPVYRRLYWSETLPDPRWTLSGTSVIRYYDLNYSRMCSLTAGTRYYNPQPSPDGLRLSVVEYPQQGGSALVVISAANGEVLRRFPLPDGIQATESAWLDGWIYIIGLGEKGHGLFRIPEEGGAWENVLPESVQKVVNLGSGEGCLEWVSDRSGVNELYRFFPADGRLLQLTSSRYGATDYTADESSLYCVSQTLKGRMLFCTPLQALQPREVAYADVAAHPMEQTLAVQEVTLGDMPDFSAPVEFSAPSRYRKLTHPLRLHSWLPLYVDYDAVKSGSADFSYETASAGLTGFFQNTLGTFSGMLGYSLHPDEDGGPWRNSLHLKATYTGLYPVIELNADWGDSDARQYTNCHLQDGNQSGWQLTSLSRGNGQLNASVRMYVPLNFSRGGLRMGLVPQLTYSVSNNIFVPGPVEYAIPGRLEGLPARYSVVSAQDMSAYVMQQLGASVRGYVTLARADSQIYPRWGAGLELGYSQRPDLDNYYAPNWYAYLYGYLPGVVRSQGLRVTAMLQRQQNACLYGDLTANTLPRGFGSRATSVVGHNFGRQWKLTADYAIPIYVGDLAIPAVAYIKNFLLTPHADYTGLSRGYDLWSVGADFSASLASILVLPFDTSLGVSFSYLGGTLYPYIGQSRPYSLSLIFSMDF